MTRKPTPRQIECLSLAGEGLSNRDIGAKLGLATSTVGGYIGNAMRILGAKSRTHAYALLKEQKLL